MSGMDFFGHQDQARAATSRLVWLFGLAVLGITVCLYVAAKGLLIATDSRPEAVDFGLFAVVALITLGIIAVAMMFKTAQLRGGGGKVAQMLGGSEVTPGRRL